MYRLIGILSILLQKDKVTSAELAEKFEVSRRTILRDIDTISMAGIPLVCEQGQGGGISISDGYKVDRTVLSSDDMQAILSGLRSLDSVSGTNRYRQLMERISYDDSVSADKDNHIIIDLSSWNKWAVTEKIELIKGAMERDERIHFRYFSPTGETEREIEPVHLVYQWSGWYVWGWCCERMDWRMFKLTRMTELVPTGNKRTQTDIPPYDREKLYHTQEETEVTVRFDKSIRWRIIDEFGAENIKYDENEDIILTFKWSDVPGFFRYMLSFGANAEILSPTEYRDEYKTLLESMLKKYSDDI